MDASKVTTPLASGIPPNPTLVLFGSDSVRLSPFSTAVIALPFDERIRIASLLASIPEIQVETTLIFLDVSKMGTCFLSELVEQLFANIAAEPSALTFTKSLLFTILSYKKEVK